MAGLDGMLKSLPALQNLRAGPGRVACTWPMEWHPGPVFAYRARSQSDFRGQRNRQFAPEQVGEMPGAHQCVPFFAHANAFGAAAPSRRLLCKRLPGSGARAGRPGFSSKPGEVPREFLDIPQVRKHRVNGWACFLTIVILALVAEIHAVLHQH